MSSKKSILAIAGLAVALIIGGMGGAVANGLITGADIKNRSVTGADLDRTSVGSPHLRKDAVKKRHLENDMVGVRHLNKWAMNMIESKAGKDGADGVSGYETHGLYTRNDGGGLGFAVEPGELRQFTVECSEGKYAFSGGITNGNTKPGKDLTIRETAPSGLTEVGGDWVATSWSVTVENETDASQHAQSFVVCASAN